MPCFLPPFIFYTNNIIQQTDKLYASKCDVNIIEEYSYNIITHMSVIPAPQKFKETASCCPHTDVPSPPKHRTWKLLLTFKFILSFDIHKRSFNNQHVFSCHVMTTHLFDIYSHIFRYLFVFFQMSSIVVALLFLRQCSWFHSFPSYFFSQ